MIRIKIKKPLLEQQSSSKMALFKIDGEWFSAEKGEGSPEQQHLILLDSDKILKILGEEKEEIIKSKKLRSPKKINLLACSIANKIIESESVLAMTSYDDAESLGHGPCSGAMEMIRLAGRGYGEKMFRLAMAAVHPKPLTMDREAVSGGREGGKITGAQGVAEKINSDPSVKKVPKNFLKYVPSEDEKETMKKSGHKYSQPIDVFDDIDTDNQITQPAEDDCEIRYYASKALNRGFISDASKSELNSLIASGKSMIAQSDEIFAEFPEYNKLFIRIMRYIAQNYFRKLYSGYVPACGK